MPRDSEPLPNASFWYRDQQRFDSKNVHVRNTAKVKPGTTQTSVVTPFESFSASYTLLLVFWTKCAEGKRALTDLSLVWTSCVWSRWNEPLVSYRWMHYNTAGNPDITKCPRGTGRVFVITWQEHPLSGFYPTHITVTGTINIFQESLLCKGVFVMSTGFTLIFNLRCPFLKMHFPLGHNSYKLPTYLFHCWENIKKKERTQHEVTNFIEKFTF